MRETGHLAEDGEGELWVVVWGELDGDGGGRWVLLASASLGIWDFCEKPEKVIKNVE